MSIPELSYSLGGRYGFQKANNAIKIPVKIPRPKNRFDLHVHRPDGDVETASGTNTITNTGMHEYLTSTTPVVAKNTGGFFRYCRVGTGTATIDATSTSLSNDVGVFADAYNSNNASIDFEFIQDTGVWYGKLTIDFPFANGAVVGNLAEVGVFKATSNTMMAGALLKDGSGTPTTVTVTSDDQLIVTYTLYFEMPPGRDYTNFTGVATDPITTINGVVNVNGTDYNYTLDLFEYYIYFSGTTTLSIHPRLYNQSNRARATIDYDDATDTFVYNNVVADGDASGSIVAGVNSLTISQTVLVNPSAGNKNITDLKFHFTSSSQGSEASTITFTPAIPKSDLETFEFNLEIEVSW